ncbi:MAG: hypothetical protein K1X88_25525 [Nannocystaceae bacterium]|nr:hypothetical protein [Nannocystaceae bacterium]
MQRREHDLLEDDAGRLREQEPFTPRFESRIAECECHGKTTPKSTEDLTKPIEPLVAAERRRAVQDAAAQAFAASSSSRARRLSGSPKMSRKSCGRRRPPEEVAQLGARLLELVRARPGEYDLTLHAGPVADDGDERRAGRRGPLRA